MQQLLSVIFHLCKAHGIYGTYEADLRRPAYLRGDNICCTAALSDSCAVVGSIDGPSLGDVHMHLSAGAYVRDAANSRTGRRRSTSRT